jgi:hypothetical protein
MKSAKISVLFTLGLMLLFVGSAVAQRTTFSNENVEYTFDLPNETWKMLAPPSKLNPNVEYVYGDRSSGHLEIRKLTVKPDDLMSDIISNEEQGLKFDKGYVAGKDEVFAGNLRGTVFNFEYVRSSRTMSGRYYFLKANPTTVYLLKFKGMKDKLITIRNQIDSIARSFEVKK